MNAYKTMLYSLVCIYQVSIVAHESHITLPNELGIRAVFEFKPEVAEPLTMLAERLLRDDACLSRGERELIAAYVSYLNQCTFCCNSHTAIAYHLLDGNADAIEAVKKDVMTAPISDKMKALLIIAGKVQQSGRDVLPKYIAQARACGATDQDIYYAVVIAAAFCMYNRIVDGLRAPTPTEMSVYDAMGKRVAQHGYRKSRRIHIHN